MVWEVEISCTCGRPLDLIWDDVTARYHAKPCPDCMQEQYKEGVSVGFDRGFDSGYNEGLKDSFCKEKEGT